MTPLYRSRMTNRLTSVFLPFIFTTTRPKSACASSPASEVSGIYASCLRFLSLLTQYRTVDSAAVNSSPYSSCSRS